MTLSPLLPVMTLAIELPVPLMLPLLLSARVSISWPVRLKLT